MSQPPPQYILPPSSLTLELDKRKSTSPTPAADEEGSCRGSSNEGCETCNSEPKCTDEKCNRWSDSGEVCKEVVEDARTAVTLPTTVDGIVTEIDNIEYIPDHSQIDHTIGGKSGNTPDVQVDTPNVNEGTEVAMKISATGNCVGSMGLILDSTFELIDQGANLPPDLETANNIAGEFWACSIMLRICAQGFISGLLSFSPYLSP